MIYASHFRRPLPRWADEGGATSVEHASEKNKHRAMLNEFLRTGRGIAFSQMFAMTDYPADIMPLYAQGYSLAEFLIQTGGRRKYVEFLGDGLESDDWSGAVQRHYGIADLGGLQNTWLAWVQQGSPPLRPREMQPLPAGEMLAANERRPRPEPNLIYRIRNKQSPATPRADLVPVRLPASGTNISPAVARSTPAQATAGIMQWTDSSRGPSSPAGGSVAAADPRSKPTALPASGWRTAGSAARPLRHPYRLRRRSMPRPRKSLIHRRWSNRGRRCCGSVRTAGRGCCDRRCPAPNSSRNRSNCYRIPRSKWTGRCCPSTLAERLRSRRRLRSCPR